MYLRTVFHFCLHVTDDDKSSSDEGAITSYLLLQVFFHFNHNIQSVISKFSHWFRKRNLGIQFLPNDGIIHLIFHHP